MDATDGRAMEHGELHEELAAGFALGALDAADLVVFERHLPDCATCAQLVSEYVAIAALVPTTLEELEPSVGLRDRILAEARASTREIHESSPPSIERGISAATATRPSPIRTFAFRWVLPLAALLTVVLGMGYWNYRLQARVAEQAALIQVQHDTLAAVARGGRQWALAGTPSAPQAGGVLVQGPDGASPLLAVSGLPDLPASQSYQAWVITGGQPVGAGILQPDGRGGQVARLERPLSSVDTVAVTIEPAGGLPAPTGPIVVAGSL